MQRFEIKEPYFSFIRNGQKIFEGRSESSRMVNETKKGDIIELYNKNNNFRVKIMEYEGPFDSVREMLIIKGVSTMLPDIYDLEIGVKKYLEEFKCNGKVYAIKFNLV